MSFLRSFGRTARSIGIRDWDPRAVRAVHTSLNRTFEKLGAGPDLRPGANIRDYSSNRELNVSACLFSLDHNGMASFSYDEEKSAETIDVLLENYQSFRQQKWGVLVIPLALSIPLCTMIPLATSGLDLVPILIAQICVGASAGSGGFTLANALNNYTGARSSLESYSCEEQRRRSKIAIDNLDRTLALIDLTEIHSSKNIIARVGARANMFVYRQIARSNRRAFNRFV